MTEVCLSELHHLWHSLGRQDGQQVCDQEIPVLLAVSSAAARLKAAQSDALALVGASTAAIDQRRVEAVHVKVLIVDEEALSDCGVAIIVGLRIELNLI